MHRLARLAPFVALAGVLVHCGANDAAGTTRAAPRSSSPPSSRDEPPSPAPDDAGGSAASEVADAGVAPPGPPGAPATPFLVGYNEAWFGSRYGSDLTSGFDASLVASTFDGIVAAGGHVVRLWLFEGLEGITLGAGSPRITGLDPSLLPNLESVLRAARARKLAVYLTALDGNAMPTDAGPTRDLYWNVLNDAYGETTAYESTVLGPLLTTLGSYQDVVYAFDLMNEIEAPRLHGYWADPFGGPRHTMQRGAAFVKSQAPWLRVTTSAGYDTAAFDIATGFFAGLGLDFYDLHVYSDTGAIPSVTQLCARAKSDGVTILLGEFGQRSHVESDALQLTATQSFLAAAKSSCFVGALPWRYDAAESYWAFKRGDGTDRPAVAAVAQAYVP